MGRRRHLGSLKSFLSNVSQLSWGQYPVFSDSELSRAHGGSGCSLMTVRSQVLLPECPEGLESLMAVTSLFIDRYSRKYSNSHNIYGLSVSFKAEKKMN